MYIHHVGKSRFGETKFRTDPFGKPVEHPVQFSECAQKKKKTPTNGINAMWINLKDFFRKRQK